MDHAMKRLLLFRPAVMLVIKSNSKHGVLAVVGGAMTPPGHRTLLLLSQPCRWSPASDSSLTLEHDLPVGTFFDLISMNMLLYSSVAPKHLTSERKGKCDSSGVKKLKIHICTILNTMAIFIWRCSMNSPLRGILRHWSIKYSVKFRV